MSPDKIDCRRRTVHQVPASGAPCINRAAGAGNAIRVARVAHACSPSNNNPMPETTPAAPAVGKATPGSLSRLGGTRPLAMLAQGPKGCGCWRWRGGGACRQQPCAVAAVTTTPGTIETSGWLRCPSAAVARRPPSSRPTGSSWRALSNAPVKPGAQGVGMWMGIVRQRVVVVPSDARHTSHGGGALLGVRPYSVYPARARPGHLSSHDPRRLASASLRRAPPVLPLLRLLWRPGASSAPVRALSLGPSVPSSPLPSPHADAALHSTMRPAPRAWPPVLRVWTLCIPVASLSPPPAPSPLLARRPPLASSAPAPPFSPPPCMPAAALRLCGLLPSLSRHRNELSSTRMCRVGVVWRLGTSNWVT